VRSAARHSRRPIFAIVTAVLAGALLLSAGVGGAATVRGTSGSDVLRGTPRADRLLGGAGRDVLHGLAGKDRLLGGAGDDKLFGDAGNDRLDGGKGVDRFFGGAGNDLVLARDGVRDTVRCGAGRDRVVADLLDKVGRDCESTSRPTVMYALSVSSSGQGSVTSSPGGINCGADCSEQYAAGTAVTLTAAAAQGWTFSGWTGACTGTDACTVFVDGTRSVQATFAPAPSPSPGPGPSPGPPPPPPTTTHTLTVTVVGSGTVASSPGGISCGRDCSESYASGTSVTLVATPTGTLGVFVGWAGGCTGTGSCTVSMGSDQTVVAVFGV
jgi:Ca2+-binding RTX toxin-like protein